MDIFGKMPHQKAFVCYRLPGDGNRFHYIQDGKSEMGKETHRFVFHPFDVKNHPVIQISGERSFLTLDGTKKIPKTPPNSSATRDYTCMLRSALKLIEGKRIDKIVLSKKIDFQLSVETSLGSSLGTLASFHPHALVYLFSHPSTGRWIGASPELLLSKNGERFETTALAGTRVASENRSWTKKEVDEQLYVSDFIEDILVKKKVENLRIHDTQTTVAGHLEHIKTIFKFNYSKASDIILSRLHPTPAVCGVPQDETQKLIEKLESHDRKYYSGYLGAIEPNGDFKYFVNLRCGEIRENTLSAYVGGGITRDSDIQKEWEETEVKSQSLLFAL